MITVDIKSLLNRMNACCTHALEGAAAACVARTHYEVTVEHYLSRLLEEPQLDIPLLLRQLGVDTQTLKRVVDEGIESLRTGNSGKPVFSPCLSNGSRRRGSYPPSIFRSSRSARPPC